jgi:uncharacterized membrane protein
MRVLEAVHDRQRALEPPVPASEAVKTWRYLRLAIVVLAAGLAASVLYEHGKTVDGCWQPSISAYYYTPAQGVLVGTLVAIGVCLVSVKGNTDWEDILLNLAGSCAPVVAFVPVPDRGTCASALQGTANRDLRIANNVTAVLIAGGVALAVLGVVAALGRWNPNRERPTRTAVAGFAGTVVVYLATVLVFLLARRWFTDWGHDVFAVALFAFVLVTVWLNAVNLYYSRRSTPCPARVVNRYTVLGILMVVALVVTGLLGLAAGWRHWQLGAEASLIGLFAVFWVLQTVELWNAGLRTAER